ISERDYKNLVTAARDNDRLKQHVRNLMSTDMAREYKKLSKEHGQVKEKYSGLVERFNENVNDYNELLEENKSLKRSEEHTSELQSRFDLVCRLLLEKKKLKKFFMETEVMAKYHNAPSNQKQEREKKNNESVLTHNREEKNERRPITGTTRHMKQYTI